MSDINKSNMDFLAKLSNLNIFKSCDFNVEQLDTKIKSLFELQNELQHSKSLNVNHIVHILDNIQNTK